MNAQPGVLDAPQEHLDIIFLNAATNNHTTLQDAIQYLSEEAGRLMEQHVASGLTVTIGFSSGFVDKCAPKRRPKALRSMPRFEGDEYDPAETQADVVVQICSNVKFANHTAGKTLLGLLTKAFTPEGLPSGLLLPRQSRRARFYRWHGQPRCGGSARRGARR